MNNEEIIEKMKEIIPDIKGRMKNITKIIKHHNHSDFFVWFEGSLFWVNHGLFIVQKDIHSFSPQYGHCIMLLSSALLHFGQSL